MTHHISLYIYFVVSCTTVLVNGDMLAGLDPPSLYKQCYGRQKRRPDSSPSITPAVGTQTACDNFFMWHNAKNTILHRKCSDETLNLIGGYVDRFANDVEHHRRKRQAGIMGPDRRPKVRVRKEIRMLSERELQLFFKAINSAKRNTTIFPNKYDAIASFHTGITAVSAHGGCNFHGWHRLYSHIMEQAIRDEGPEFEDFAMPYWDSRLETRMAKADPDSNMEPTRSALFSDRLMGSCNGPVRGGLMGTGWNSSIGEIIRNCGMDGPLMTDEMVYNVTRQRRMRDICGEDSRIGNDLENHHNGAHRWCDGNMALLSTSVYDPIFWIHHVFIDLIWEYFRRNSKQSGVDITTDYPLNPTIMGAHEMQIPDAEMGFPSQRNVTVIDGLSEVFTERFFRYAPPPSCTIGKPDCGSKYLKCVIDRPPGARRRRALCVARTLEEVIAWEEEQTKPKPEPCPEPTTPKPTQRTTTPKPTTPKPPPVDPKPPKPKPPPTEIKPYQNTFCMNGKSDSGQWAFFPMKVIVKRPPDYKEYGSYPVERGKINKMRGDIFSPGAYSNVNRHLRNSDHPAVYEDCQTPDEPTNEIYIKSIGLNYEGIYKEYVIVDKRLPMSVNTAYIAMRKPTSDVDESIAMLHAQDRCGRVCKPVCKVPGTEVFRPCSGAVRLTGKYPLMFGNSFGDAVLDVWDFNTEKSCPQLTTQNIMISFYCDYKADWIWPTEEPPPPPRPVVRTTPLPFLEKTTVSPGCVVGFRCAVSRACRHLAPCQHKKVYECVSACHAYGICAHGKFYLTYCTRGQTYDRRTQKCEPGYCNMRTSGVRNPITRRMNKKRRRKFMGR